MRVLGIEGGGTKTDWIVLDYESGVPQIVEQGRLPASNLKLASDKVLADLFAVLPRQVTHVGVFLAGCGTDADRRRLRVLVEAAWPAARMVIGSDRDSGLATAFQDGDGIVVIAGTGAAVHGRSSGRIEKAGGWGQLLGDRGGGYHLAMQGLRLVLSQYDLNQQITPLAQTILRNLALNRLQDLVDWAMQADKMSVARLAPAVFDAARSGERETFAILHDGAGILAQFTRAVAQRLEFDTPRVKLIGGLFAHHPEYVALFESRLQALLPGATAEICTTSGAVGAAWLAARENSGAAGEKNEEPRREPAAELARAATEQSNPRSVGLDRLATAEFVDLFVREEHHVTAALTACRDALIAAVDLTSAALRAGGRLFYVGAGTSGRLGVLDASEIPPTFGAPPELVQGIIAGGAAALHRAVEGAEDQTETGAFVMLDRGVTALDVVCGITASGRTPFVLGALEQSRKLGAKTLLLTCNPARLPTPPPWDVEIDLPTGPEIVTGSTRLKAGTATKVALNVISTGAMVRLGKVRGNAMIDLAVSNTKLRDRAARLVSTALEVSYEEARERLERVGWNVRAALPQ